MARRSSAISPRGPDGRAADEQYRDAKGDSWRATPRLFEGAAAPFCIRGCPLYSTPVFAPRIVEAMPPRTDIHTILIIGSRPIVIGQGCEFDYSGVQACRALEAEGYRVVLINSNPATVMTDPEFADEAY